MERTFVRFTFPTHSLRFREQITQAPMGQSRTVPSERLAGSCPQGLPHLPPSERRPKLSRGANSKINIEKLCIVDIEHVGEARSLANKKKSKSLLLNKTQNLALEENRC